MNERRREDEKKDRGGRHENMEYHCQNGVRAREPMRAENENPKER